MFLEDSRLMIRGISFDAAILTSQTFCSLLYQAIFEVALCNPAGTLWDVMVVGILIGILNVVVECR